MLSCAFIEASFSFYVLLYPQGSSNLWILVSSTNKISYVWVRNVGFNLCLHKKLIGILVWWYRVIINSEYYRLKISKKKKKKKKSSSNLPMRFLVMTYSSYL